MSQPIAVLGLGAVGGLVAARSGALCVGSERTVEAIRERGLRLVHGGEATVTRPEVATRLESPVALLVIAVKAYDLGAALDRVAPEVLGDALILPLQNGLEHVPALRVWAEGACNSLLQAPPIVAAGSIGTVSAAAPEPGVVVLATDTPATIRVASRDLSAAELTGRLEPLAVSGLEVVVGESESEVLWEKAARLAVLAAATVASGRAVGPLRDDPDWRPRLQNALREACAVAAAGGVELDPAAQWAIIRAMPGDLTTSAARDAVAGRQTELDAITGSVVRAGARLGVPTPALSALLEEAACRPR